MAQENQTILEKAQLIPELVFNNVFVSRMSFDGVCWIDVDSVEEDAGDIVAVNLEIASWGEDALAIFKHLPAKSLILGAEDKEGKTFVKIRVENPTNYSVQLSIKSEQVQPAPKETVAKE